MSTIVAIRDAAALTGGEYSPAKEKAANRGVYNGRSPLLHRCIKQFVGGFKFKLLIFLALFSVFFWFSSHVGAFMGWNSLPDSAVLSSSRVQQVRTFPNGLVIVDVSMGRPDGKKAVRGKKVSVYYVGKLKKTKKIFDSNIGGEPFKFRLGIGEVIKGWDVGVNGMRVGDKRRLTIPPSMGYGDKGAGTAIPPNAWLVFDVELVDVA